MNNRWLDTPTIHDAHFHGEKNASWLELFFDLIFVAAFIQLGNLLSANLNTTGVVAFVAAFGTLWFLWAAFAWIMDRFTIDDAVHRLMTFGLMFCIGGMAITAGGLVDGNPDKFAWAAAAGFAMLAFINLRLHVSCPEARRFTRYWAAVFGLAAVAFLVVSFLPVRFQIPGIFTVTILAMIAPFTPESSSINSMFTGDEEHFAERFALLTLIVLGESFVKILSDLSGTELRELTIFFEACFVLLITCTIWWTYFDDVAGAHRKQRPLSELMWMFGHLPLHAGITVLAVGLKKAVHFDLGAAPPETYRWTLCAGLAATFFAVSLIDSVTERKDSDLDDQLRVNVRLASAIIVLLLTAAGGAMTAAAYLGLVLLVCVAQVVFDIMWTPETPGHSESQGVSMAEEMNRRLEASRRGGEADLAQRPRFNPEEAVRRGRPNQFRRDVYSFFIRGTWKQTFMVLGIVYFLFNVFFASLYALQPGSISGTADESFWDAFFFSVQTFSTIGFGGLTPATTYADTIVSFEAGTALLFTALATGLMFAKASRPGSSIMFTQNLLVTQRDGVSTLTLRLANASGHEVVDANISVTALIDEITAEGDHLRRMHDLRLVRERSPFFALSWSVMHVIDESSPLFGMSETELRAQVGSILCTLVGYDATYSQTIHARHHYIPDDVVFGGKFHDVISVLPDGRIMIDYEHFNTVEDA